MGGRVGATGGRRFVRCSGGTFHGCPGPCGPVIFRPRQPPLVACAGPRAKGVRSVRREHSHPRRAPRGSRRPGDGPIHSEAAVRRPRLAEHQRHPGPGHGRGGGGPIRPSGHSDGARPRGVRALAPVPPAQPHQSRLARPRSLRPLLRPRLDAAVCPAPPGGVRGVARRPARVPPVGLGHAGPPRARPHAGGGNHHRAAGPGGGQRGRYGRGRAIPRRALQPAGPPGHRPPDLGLRERRRPDGRRGQRGRLARGAPAARQADADLRR
jgi:hypothetical protein